MTQINANVKGPAAVGYREHTFSALRIASATPWNLQLASIRVFRGRLLLVIRHSDFVILIIRFIRVTWRAVALAKAATI